MLSAFLFFLIGGEIMMIVEEKRLRGRTCYIVETDELRRIVECRLVKLERDGKIYFILYDDFSNRNMDFFAFINFYLDYKAYNTREMYACALRLLYCFLTITHTDIERMNIDDVNALKNFLLGRVSTKGNMIYKISGRKKLVVNSYLGVYRTYFKYCGFECDALFETKLVTVSDTFDGETSKNTVTKYQINEDTANLLVKVPRYISLEEFRSILVYLRTENNKMAEIIIRLMYEAGLRIGEVLSITSEDVCRKKMDGEMKPVIYLRNRIHKGSNGRKVSCKGLIKVQSKDSYNLKGYSEEGMGYEIVPVSESLYRALNDYIDDFLDTADNDGYIDNFEADSVIKNKHKRKNYYIYSNKKHERLSNKNWNEKLRRIFIAVGILLDNDKRKHNLNHRFRHGFAMFHVQYRHIDVLQLSKLMRHRSLASTMVYYRPTETDEYNLKTDFTQSLYENIKILGNRNVLEGSDIDGN